MEHYDDPERNVVLMDGYNGGPRGGGELCSGDECLRDTMEIKSGTRVVVPHAEMNLICNSAANGVPTNGAWLIVTGEPCMMCAKLIHHSGIGKVVIVDGGFSGENGVSYLENHGVPVQELMDRKTQSLMTTRLLQFLATHYPAQLDTCLEIDRSDFSCFAGNDFMLHFHCLENHQSLSFFNYLSNLDLHFSTLPGIGALRFESSSVAEEPGSTNSNWKVCPS